MPITKTFLMTPVHGARSIATDATSALADMGYRRQPGPRRGAFDFAMTSPARAGRNGSQWNPLDKHRLQHSTLMQPHFGFRSVAWEATRVGDIIGAESWWRAQGRRWASAFLASCACDARRRRRALARSGRAQTEFSARADVVSRERSYLDQARDAITAPAR